VEREREREREINRKRDRQTETETTGKACSLGFLLLPFVFVPQPPAYWVVLPSGQVSP
jgi:hypothetical protein